MTIEDIVNKVCKLPYCKINREKFLKKQLKHKVTPAQLAYALEHGTVNAQIPVTILDEIAKGSIALETTKVTLTSFAAGIPGGLAMIGTVPTDLAQFYAHVLRLAQKLAYIYGSEEIELSDGAQNKLMIYLGAMFGVNAASAALAKFAAANAATIGARVAAQPLTQYAVYNISKKILLWINVRLTKDVLGKTVTKAIPLVSGFLSGGLSFTMYRSMANMLQKELSKYTAMSPEDLAEASAAADAILADFEEVKSITVS